MMHEPLTPTLSPPGGEREPSPSEAGEETFEISEETHR